MNETDLGLWAVPLAMIGGAITSAVLLIGALSLTASTTEAQMMPMASAVVVLPVGLIVAAIGFYVARRVYVTLRPPLIDPAEHESP